jgi:hypothetical protein
LKWFGGLFIEGVKSVIDISKYDLIIRLIASGAVITKLCKMSIREILARKRNELLNGRTVSESRTLVVIFTPVKLTDSNF